MKSRLMSRALSVQSVERILQRQQHTNSCSTQLGPASTWRHWQLMTSTVMTMMLLRRTFCPGDRDQLPPAAALDNLLLPSMLVWRAAKSLARKSPARLLHQLRLSVLCQILLRKQTTRRRGFLYFLHDVISVCALWCSCAVEYIVLLCSFLVIEWIPVVGGFYTVPYLLAISFNI